MYQTIPVGDSSGQGLIREGVSSFPRRLMQLRPVAGLAVAEYVSVRTWRRASPGACLLHGKGRCSFPGMAPRSARRRSASPACTHDVMPACVHARQRTTRHGPFASIEITGLDPLADRIVEIAVGGLRGEVPQTASTGLRGTTGTILTLRTKPGVGPASSKNLGKDGSAMRCPASCLQCQPPLCCYRLLSCRHPGRTCTLSAWSLARRASACRAVSFVVFTSVRPFRFPGIWFAPLRVIGQP